MSVIIVLFTDFLLNTHTKWIPICVFCVCVHVQCRPIIDSDIDNADNDDDDDDANNKDNRSFWNIHTNINIYNVVASFYRQKKNIKISRFLLLVKSAQEK